MYCNQCGNQLPDHSLFCNHCGARLPTNSTTGPAPAPPNFTPRPARRNPVKPQPAVPYYQTEKPEEFEEADSYEEEEPEPLDEEESDEDVVFRIMPSFYNVGVAYAATIIVSVCIIVGATYIKLPFSIALIIAIACFIYPINQHVQLRRVVYTLTPVKIEIESGILSQSVRNIPLRQVQDVTVNQTFRERIIGVGDVLIDSAAIEGKITMSHINDPRKYADLILDQLENWID